MAGICINNQGPFPFLVDTGASGTLIDTGVAHRLHIRALFPGVSINSFGCRRSIAVGEVDDWQLGSVRLDSQAVLVGQLTSPLIPTLAGLLGADTLSRFGAVRLDYSAGSITLGSRRPPLTADVTPTTARSPALPPALSAGTTRSVPMAVRARSARPPGSDVDLSLARPTVPASVAGRPYLFLVDTGAALTVVSPSLARTSRLPGRAGATSTYAGLACRITVHFYDMIPWHIASVALGSQVVGSNQLPAGIDGLLGSGTLEEHSPVVVDFSDGRLLLNG